MAGIQEPSCQQPQRLHTDADNGLVKDGSENWCERFRNVPPYPLANNNCTFPCPESGAFMQPFLYPANPIPDSSHPSSFPWQRMGDSISLENTAELLDPYTLLLDVDNRFSNRILTTESIALENTLCGFKKFMMCNRARATHCWQKQIGPSYVGSRELEEKVVPHITKNDILDKTLVKEEKFDNCADLYAAFRCRLFLKGKECDGLCQKIHRIPKDDGVLCISQKHGQCYHGSKCNFLHEETFDDCESDDDVGRLPTRETTVGLLLQRLNNFDDQLGNEIVLDDTRPNHKLEYPSENVELFDPLPFGNFVDRKFAVDPNSHPIDSAAAAVPIEKDSSGLKLCSLDTLLQSAIGVKMERETEDPIKRLKLNNSTRSPRGPVKVSTSASPTKPSDNVPTCLKRALASPARPPVKKEKIEDSICVQRKDSSEPIVRTLKREPVDEVLKEEIVEDMVAMPVKSEVYSIMDPSIDQILSSSPVEERKLKVSNNLVCNKKLTLGFDYEMPTVDRLLDVGSHVLNIIGEMEKKQETAPTASSDVYGRLCEYLVNRGIEILSEVNNSKLLVWDVHIRLFFNSILGLDNRDYLRDIEKHLVTENFENYLNRVFTYFEA